MKKFSKIFKIIFSIFIYFSLPLIAQKSDDDKLIEEWKSKITKIDKKMEGLKVKEGLYNSKELSGFTIGYLENNQPLRILLGLEQKEETELQIFSYEKSNLIFVYLTRTTAEEGWQFYFKNNKLVLIINFDGKKIPETDFIVYKHFEKELLRRAALLYKENIEK